MHVTDCECTEPGWCERHQCEKTRYCFELCRRRQDFFQLWEEKRGPGQGNKRSPNLARQRPCRHLGRIVDERPCQGCRGQVRVKIFYCPIHGECSLGRQVDNTACCAVCEDYDAADAFIEPPEAQRPNM